MSAFLNFLKLTSLLLVSIIFQTSQYFKGGLLTCKTRDKNRNIKTRDENNPNNFTMKNREEVPRVNIEFDSACVRIANL